MHKKKKSANNEFINKIKNSERNKDRRRKHSSEIRTRYDNINIFSLRMRNKVDKSNKTSSESFFKND
jgi:hypothetical protein